MKIIFKHSTRCPISAQAKYETDNFLRHYPGEVEYELIDVINNRGRSNEVAEVYGIPHESPQILIFAENDTLIWTASHSRITEKNINSAISDSV
jgi:bacillithiol system protein YtxJ